MSTLRQQSDPNVLLQQIRDLLKPDHLQELSSILSTTHEKSDVTLDEIKVRNSSLKVRLKHWENELTDLIDKRISLELQLKLQQQQLLSMLKTMEAKTTREVVKNVDCGTQIDFEDESFLPQGSVLAATKENAQPSTAQTLKKEESLDDTMPVSVFVSTHSCA